MTPTERAHAWQQHITDWQASGVSGSAYGTPRLSLAVRPAATSIAGKWPRRSARLSPTLAENRC
ncbi:MULTISPECIES: hypothetical protein [unclassified Marinobacter]|uniref:hypothetical protein n=1 Tax=unclassified Marinobacter TaxID=83889 RepID=UPI00200CD172|nr:MULTISPECIES: hypothetical protein [unclassified Marinobacter]MCL1488039.1 hypothetical protein [Marinobacter sp.]UQG56039.1 hypothetical protein MIH16_22055 [Marinobacter sp. M4C]UQG69122.1 hypothetical protein MIH19_22060 [Marinobacter sp. M1C]